MDTNANNHNDTGGVFRSIWRGLRVGSSSRRDEQQQRLSTPFATAATSEDVEMSSPTSENQPAPSQSSQNGDLPPLVRSDADDNDEAMPPLQSVSDSDSDYSDSHSEVEVERMFGQHSADDEDSDEEMPPLEEVPTPFRLPFQGQRRARDPSQDETAAEQRPSQRQRTTNDDDTDRTEWRAFTLNPNMMATDIPIPPGFNLAELFTQLMGGLVQEEREDPEKAKKLVEALEEVPEGLVRRVERVGEGGGDGGCAICWDKLLDSQGFQPDTEPKPQSSHESSQNMPSESSEDAPTTSADRPEASPSSESIRPRIVALPCAHVFHASCLIPWFARPKQTTCPTCRFNIDPHGLTSRRAHQRRPPAAQGQDQQAPPPPPRAGLGGLQDELRRQFEQFVGNIAAQADQTQQPPPPPETQRWQEEARTFAGVTVLGGGDFDGDAVLFDLLGTGPRQAPNATPAAPPSANPQPAADAPVDQQPTIVPQTTLPTTAPQPTENATAAPQATAGPRRPQTQAELDDFVTNLFNGRNGTIIGAAYNGIPVPQNQNVQGPHQSQNRQDEPQAPQPATNALPPQPTATNPLPNFPFQTNAAAGGPQAQLQTLINGILGGGNGTVVGGFINGIPIPFAGLPPNLNGQGRGGEGPPPQPNIPAFIPIPAPVPPPATGPTAAPQTPPAPEEIDISEEGEQARGAENGEDRELFTLGMEINFMPIPSENDVQRPFASEGAGRRRQTQTPVGPSRGPNPASGGQGPAQGQDTFFDITTGTGENMTDVLGRLMRGSRQARTREAQQTQAGQQQAGPSPQQQRTRQPRPRTLSDLFINPPTEGQRRAPMVWRHIGGTGVGGVGVGRFRTNNNIGESPFMAAYRNVIERGRNGVNTENPPPAGPLNAAGDTAAVNASSGSAAPPAPTNVNNPTANPAVAPANTNPDNNATNPPRVRLPNMTNIAGIPIDARLSMHFTFIPEGNNTGEGTGAFHIPINLGNFTGVNNPEPPAPMPFPSNWSPPPAPGPTLRERVEKREREEGLRCSDVNCWYAPSDEDPEPQPCGASVKQVNILREEGDEHGKVCEHTFHPSCLVSAQRVALKGAEPKLVGQEESWVEVQCPTCRLDGVVPKSIWEQGTEV